MPVVNPPTTSSAAPARRRNWLGWALALFILVSCTFFIDLGELWTSLQKLSLVELMFLVLLSTADRALMGYKWGVLLRIANINLPMWRVIRFFYQGSFSGVFLPSHVGGDLLRAWWVIEASGVKHPVFASLVVERLIGLISAVNWAVLGGVVYGCVVMPAMGWAWILLGVLAATGANLVFMAVLSSRMHGFVLDRLGRYRRLKPVRLLHDFYEAYAGFSKDPRRLALNALLTVVEQALQMSLFYAIALSIDVPTDFVSFFAAATLFTLIWRLPVAPDGWGVSELTAIGIFGLIGISATDAFMISVIGHIIPMLALSPGFLFLLQRQPPPLPAELPRT